jgi:hypothetical protein
MSLLTDAKVRELAAHWQDMEPRHREHVGAHHGRLARLLTELAATAAADQARHDMDSLLAGNPPARELVKIPPAIRKDTTP